MNLKQRRSCCLFGCITPFILIATIVVAYLLFWNWKQTFYIPDIQMYVQIKNVPFGDKKMSFSKNEDFGTDYVKYNMGPEIMYMDIYYIPPQTIYVSNASCVKQKEFEIIEFEEVLKYHKREVSPEHNWVPEYYTEYTDSTFLKEDSYYFDIYPRFLGFSVEDPEGNTIFTGGTE